MNLMVKYFIPLLLILSSCSIFYKNTPLKNTTWQIKSIYDADSQRNYTLPDSNPLFMQFKSSYIYFGQRLGLNSNKAVMYIGMDRLRLMTLSHDKDFWVNFYMNYTISVKNIDSIGFYWPRQVYLPEKGEGGSLKRFNKEIFDVLFKVLTGYGTYSINDERLIIHIINSMEKPVNLKVNLKRIGRE